MFNMNTYFIISNSELKNYPSNASKFNIGRFHIYSGQPLDNMIAQETLNIDIEKLWMEDDCVNNERSIITVNDTKIIIESSSANVTPIYYVLDQQQGKLAVFNNIFLSKYILDSLGIELIVDNRPGVYFDSGTPLKYVNRITHDTIMEFNSPNGELVIRNTLRGILPENKIEDALEGGDLIVSSLDNVIEDYSKIYSSATILLSGGIDSGTVAYLCTKHNIKLQAFTVGTPWGTEVEQAREIADFVKADLNYIMFDEDKILSTLIDSVYFLEGYNEDLVDIGITNACFLKYWSGSIPNIITGYGSDLLNAGYFRNPPTPKTLESMISMSIYRTKYTNEFSTKMSTSYARPIYNPFWNSSVRENAARVSHKVKWVDGQDKYCFRYSMAKHLPSEIAWRKKVAVHQGNSLQSGVASLLKDRFKISDKQDFYRRIFDYLVANDIFDRDYDSNISNVIGSIYR